MRIRETKYPSRAAAYAAVQWASGDRDWIDAYQDGKMLPADMPDELCSAVAEMIQMHMTLAESHFTELMKLLTEEKSEEG